MPKMSSKSTITTLVVAALLSPTVSGCGGT